ncbi:MAG: 50S ribosomal protein L28 [Deltaproteobacteria bacterium]|nr:MAG: 50S ribosomal protein L28 [Deltaproteobacteria bacterium]
MSRVCQVTGKSALVGNKISHSNRKSKRRFEVNLRSKRYWFEEENRWIRLRVSARGMRIIDKKGLAAVVREMRARGEKV